MKNFAKLFLVLALFTSTAVADDGHTGTGNRGGCTVDCPPACTEECSAADGTTSNVETGSLENEASNGSEGSLVDYLTSMWETFNNGL